MTSPSRRKHRTTARNIRPAAKRISALLVALIFVGPLNAAGPTWKPQSKTVPQNNYFSGSFSSPASKPLPKPSGRPLQWRPKNQTGFPAARIATVPSTAPVQQVQHQEPAAPQLLAPNQGQPTDAFSDPFGDNNRGFVLQQQPQPNQNPAEANHPPIVEPQNAQPMNVVPRVASRNHNHGFGQNSIMSLQPAITTEVDPCVEKYRDYQGEDRDCLIAACKLGTMINTISLDVSPNTDGKLPYQCIVGNEPFYVREWCPITMTWKASALCHKPLYFEHRQLERYGHSAGPVLQPVCSAAHFFTNIAFLPYKMGINPPTECQYALGYYRPGSCAPWLVDPVPISVRGTLLQAGAMLGGIYSLP